jgi:sterol desaturase/sphingolipid hydroxylase (fatty acid hydroxylase superfamily)
MDWLAGSRQHIIELLITRSRVLTPICLLLFEKNIIGAFVVILGFQAVSIMQTLKLTLLG